MSGPVTPPLTVSDVADGGSVTGRPITTIEVTDGTLTVSGRTATITTGGGGGSGTVTSITAAADSGTGTAITTSGTFTFTGGTGVTTSVSGTTVTIVADNNGDVTATGTPVDNQLAVWDSATSIEGDANLTWDGSTLSVTGALDIDNIKIDGNTISSTDTDGAIDLSPDGAGVVTMYNAYRFPTAVTASNDYVLTAQTDGTTAWAEVSGGSGTVTSVAGSGTSGITVTGGPITTSGTLTVDLDDTAVTPGTYGDASNVAQITIDQRGRITAAADVAISGGGSPGGSDTEIQFNDGGSFAGNAAMTFDKTSGDEQVLISASSTVAPLKVVQTGAGNAFEVHDSAGDTNTFNINALGRVGIMTAASNSYGLKINDKLSVADQIEGPTGSVGSPSYSFGGDTNTGMYLTSSDNVSIAAGGTECLRVSASGLQAIPVGTLATPAISFSGDTNTGIYHSAANELNLVTDGSMRVSINANGIQVGDNTAAGYISSEGAQNLVLQTNEGTDSGTITIQDAANQDILIEPDGTGLVTFYTGANSWTIENGQGAANQVLTTDGAGAATWEDAGGGGGNDFNGVLNPAGTYFAAYGVNIGGMAPYGGCDQTTGTLGFAQVRYWPFISPNTGDLASMTVKVTGASADGVTQVAVYADDGGKPGDLVGYAEFDTTSAASITQSTLSDTIALVKGTQYWYAETHTTSNLPTMTRMENGGAAAIGINADSFTDEASGLRAMGIQTLQDPADMTDVIPATLDRLGVIFKW